MKLLIIPILLLLMVAASATSFNITRDNGTITALYVDGTSVTVHQFIIAGGTFNEPMPSFALGRVTTTVEPTPTPVPTPFPTTVNTTVPTTKPTTQPGFGALVALVGLGAVAFLVVRKQ